MTDQQLRDQRQQEQSRTNNRWAPWWLYLVVIVPANYLRRAVLPESRVPVPDVMVALAFSALLFAVVTIAYRAARQATRGE